MPNHECLLCNFSTAKKSTYENHIKSKKHLETISSQPVQELSVSQVVELNLKEENKQLKEEIERLNKEIERLKSNELLLEQKGLLRIQTKMKVSNAKNISEWFNEKLNNNDLPILKMLNSGSHGNGLICIDDLAELHTKLTVNPETIYDEIFFELFKDPLTSPIICSDLTRKICYVKHNDEWVKYNLEEFNTLDHKCSSGRTRINDFEVTCKSCMLCVEIIKPEYKNMDWQDRKEMEQSITRHQYYNKQYSTTENSFRPSSIDFKFCCIHGLIREISDYVIFAIKHTLQLIQCKKLKVELSNNKDIYDEIVTEIAIAWSSLPITNKNQNERKMFANIYTNLCQLTHRD